MATVKISKKLKDDYEKIFDAEGRDKFYGFVLGNAILTLSNGAEIVLLDRADAFFSLARNTGNEKYFIMGSLLRKAAHKLYRKVRQNNSDYPINIRFLNLVKS